MEKKMVLLLSAMMMAAPAISVSAEDLEVQMIGGGDTAAGAASLDDVQLEEIYEIEGFARIQPLSFEFVNYFNQYEVGMNGNNEYSTDYIFGQAYWGSDWGNQYYNNIYYKDSGENTDFAWFLVDITNRQQEAAGFMGESTQVKVVFDEDYEYAGWVRQFNYDYDTERQFDDEVEGKFIRAAIQPDSEELLEKMYTGHYVFGCTLPNEVVNGEEPLSMIITLGDNEITYNIRK